MNNEMSKMMNETVKSWWMNSYKDKDTNKCFREGVRYFANDVKNTKITFAEVLKGLAKGDDFYKMCGVGDSEVRGVIFCRLCEIYDLNYDIVFDMWLGGLTGVEERVSTYKKLAKYRGKNDTRFIAKVCKELHCAFELDATADDVKKMLNKYIADYEKIMKILSEISNIVK